MDTNKQPETEHTREDFQRTQQRILNSYEAGHGVELSPAEVERVVAMMQGMESVMHSQAAQAQETQKLLVAVLHAHSTDGKVEVTGELLEEMVAGYNASWDEETNIVTFELIYPDDEPVEGEVVEEDAA